MRKNPLISVIIPAYNEERYLRYCLDSIEKQTYASKEILVIDDGSTDDTREIAREFDVKVLSQAHKGPGYARNMGARHAHGEILAFLDADMRYDKAYLEKLIVPILQKKAIGTFNKDERVANKSNIWSQCWSVNAGLPIGKRAHGNLPDSLPIFRSILRTEFMSVGGFDPSMGYFDDITISKKLGKKAVSAPGAISYHYNPETLGEVFYSARWIGRSERFSRSFSNIMRYSVVNSFLNGIRKLKTGAPLPYLWFKIVYDFGMLSGILNSSKNTK